MRISIIGPGIMPIPPTGWGAVEILIWDYYQELTKLGHEVQIVNTQNAQEIANQVNSFNPDFVHLQYEKQRNYHCNFSSWLYGFIAIQNKCSMSNV